jgi:hypothetical protein
MFSIEINSHTLVYLSLLAIQQHLPIECLNVSIFNSQSCESTFRSCRAMSGPFSSIVNFSVHQFLQRAKTLSYLNSIKSRNHDSDTNNSLVFPRHHKLSKLVNSKQVLPLSSSSSVPLSLEAIEITILRAYSNVCRLVVDMNMCQQDQLLPLEKMSKLQGGKSGSRDCLYPRIANGSSVSSIGLLYPYCTLRIPDGDYIF